MRIEKFQEKRKLSKELKALPGDFDYLRLVKGFAVKLLKLCGLKLEAFQKLFSDMSAI